MSEPTINLDLIMGHCEVYSWLEPCENGFIGMGRIVERDRHGKIIRDETAPTGISLIEK